jgi:hypothetical protein
MPVPESPFLSPPEYDTPEPPQPSRLRERVLALRSRLQDKVSALPKHPRSVTDMVTDLLPLIADALDADGAPPESELSADQRAIAEECDALKAMLLEKNRAYGSSAFDPVRIFSRSDALEQINVRIDDKLSRIARADPNALGEDTEADLLGYLVLRRIQRRRMRREAMEALAKGLSQAERIAGLDPNAGKTVARVTGTSADHPFARPAAFDLETGTYR